jgi:hypothetical protein
MGKRSFFITPEIIFFAGVENHPNSRYGDFSWHIHCYQTGSVTELD